MKWHVIKVAFCLQKILCLNALIQQTTWYLLNFKHELYCLCLPILQYQYKILQNHFSWRRPLRSSPIIYLTTKSTAKSHPTAPHTHFLNASRDYITVLGSLFQCITPLSMKKFSLVANPNVPWHNLRLFPCILWAIFSCPKHSCFCAGHTTQLPQLSTFNL